MILDVYCKELTEIELPRIHVYKNITYDFYGILNMAEFMELRLKIVRGELTDQYYIGTYDELGNEFYYRINKYGEIEGLEDPVKEIYEKYTQLFIEAARKKSRGE